MKLVLLTQHHAPHFEGGTESVVRAQARELALMGHDVRVVSGTDRAHEGTDTMEEEPSIKASFCVRLICLMRYSSRKAVALLPAIPE